jgi:hypothetical protein
MLSLCADFEDSLTDDTSFPSLKNGDKVSLSFYVRSNNFEISNEAEYFFKKIEYSEYNFSGKVIYKHSTLIILDTTDFKFFMNIGNAKRIKKGQFIKGIGKLLIDDPFRGELKGFDMFYSFIIKRIIEVPIPEKYIKISEQGGVSHPASLSIIDLKNTILKTVENMYSNITYMNYKYYMLELMQINEKVEKTFFCE